MATTTTLNWAKTDDGYESACGGYLLAKTKGRRWQVVTAYSGPEGKAFVKRADAEAFAQQLADGAVPTTTGNEGATPAQAAPDVAFERLGEALAAGPLMHMRRFPAQNNGEDSHEQCPPAPVQAAATRTTESGPADAEETFDDPGQDDRDRDEDDGPDPAEGLQWSLAASDEDWGSCLAHRWRSRCGGYRVTRMAPADGGPLTFGAEYRDEAVHSWLSCEGDKAHGAGYPRYYRTLDEALGAAQRHHALAHALEGPAPGNRQALTMRAERDGLAGLASPPPPAAPAKAPQTVSKRRSATKGGSAPEKAAKPPKAPKAPREATGDADWYGSRPGTGTYAINAVLDATPRTCKEIAELCGQEPGRTGGHLRTLALKGLVVKVGSTYALKGA